MPKTESRSNALIRPVGCESAELLARMHELCLGGGQAFSLRSWTSQEFEDLLRLPSCRALVATQKSDQDEGGEMPVGFAIATFARDQADLLFIGVVPDRLRLGLGRQILGNLLEIASAQGVRSMILEVAEENGPACMLYRRCGFLEIGKRRDYYRQSDGQTQNAVVLKLDL